MRRVLAACGDGLHVVPGGGRELTGYVVRDVAVAPDGWWALTASALWRRDRGGTWFQAAALGPHEVHCLLPRPGDVLVGTAGARLLRVTPDGTVSFDEGFDEAEGRDAWYTPWGGPPDTRSLALDAGGTTFASVHVGGILRSTGDGWEPTALDIDTDVHQVVAHPDRPGVLYAAAAVGLALSEDGGQSWEVRHEGLHATYCRAVAVAGERLLVSASTGPGGRQSTVYAFADGGFERLFPDGFSDNVDTRTLVAEGSWAALATPEGEVLLSEDAGRTWTRIGDGLVRVEALALV